eukprot:XP_008190138.1 PREDICTED: zinc finger BED domain-containing protein 4-like [Acyrthosiphon pisum]
MPLNTVKKKGFQNFIKKTLPLYKCPSRRSITRMIDTKYDVAKSVFLSEDKILKMKQECPTRWNSAFYMLERFILLSEIIARVLFQLDTTPQNLTSLEIKVIRESIILLQPFEEITREIAGEKFMTASKIIPIRTLLKKNIESHIISVTNEGKMLQQRLKIEFYQKFHDVEKETLLAICTILDPRFKRVHFQSPLSAANAIGLIDAEIKKATRTYRLENTSVSEVSTEGNKISLWGEHDAMVNTENVQYNDDEVNCEKRLYLQQPIIDRKQSPIEFWLKSPFSILTKIALKYLTVVATSVPSERLFSKAGNIITDNRSRLNHRRLEKLVFLSSLECKFWDL